jgi:cytochrome c oxidase cbb3-type subunit 3
VWDGDLTEYNNPLPQWWLNLFWITICVRRSYLLLFPGFGNMPGVLGWSSSGPTPRSATTSTAHAPAVRRYLRTDLRALAADPEARAMGERLFLNYCAACHGSSATGARLPKPQRQPLALRRRPETIETRS